MVVWEDGQMKKSDYRKFIIRGVIGVDDFASMREVVTRRYKRIQEEKQKKMPSLVLIDGGLGQLHAAAEALEALEIINQPLAAIAKREEIIYVYGQESEPVALDHHSPVLHLVQLIRDEAHRFAVTFHRKRRQMRDRSTELREIPGVGKARPGDCWNISAACRPSSRRIRRRFRRWLRAVRRRQFWITSGSRTHRCSSMNSLPPRSPEARGLSGALRSRGNDLWLVLDCRSFGLGRSAELLKLRRTSHATVASIPHQPRKLTTAAIFVSYGNTPRLEKMVCQSCSMKSESPAVTSGRTMARASAM